MLTFTLYRFSAPKERFARRGPPPGAPRRNSKRRLEMIENSFPAHPRFFLQAERKLWRGFGLDTV